MCLYQRACCIAYHVPMLWVVLWCRWWQGTQQKGFLAGEEYSEGTKACWVMGLLRFPFNNLYILGALQTVKLSLCSQLLHGPGSSRGYWGWGCSCPWKIWGKKVNPKDVEVFHLSWKGHIWGVSLGLVLCGDGVKEVQDGREISWSLGSKLCTGLNTEGQSGYLVFLHCEE